MSASLKIKKNTLAEYYYKKYSNAFTLLLLVTNSPAATNKHVLNNSLNCFLDDSMSWRIGLFSRALLKTSVTSHPYCCS